MTQSSQTSQTTTNDLQFYVTDEHGHAEGSTMLGFWIYLMSDCLIFAVLFSVYAVLGRIAMRRVLRQPNSSNCPRSRSTRRCCLLSSITFGFAMLVHGAEQQMRNTLDLDGRDGGCSARLSSVWS